jgi:predicted dehydrogenase
MSSTPTRIGIMGCGVISGIYIETSQKMDVMDCIAVADVNPDAAKYRANQYGVPKACSPEELLADPDVEIIISLTPILLHGKVGLQILQAGKHLYGEKPFTVYRDEALTLLAEANGRGLRTGAAPDTFFGGSWQTARRAIDEGMIGRPIAASVCLQGRPAPAPQGSAPRPVSPTRSTVAGHVGFSATTGGKYGVGTTFDRGPYYLHALISLLGPARRVVGMTAQVFEETMRAGYVVKVESPTHVTGVVEFANGVLCQWLTTSDVYDAGLPHIEIYGTEGSLRCPDPNWFDRPILLRKPGSKDYVEVECKHAINQDTRGIGVADMAVAIKNGRPHRASGEMGTHVTDILNALHESADKGVRIDLQTTCAQPRALPAGMPNWTIDD